MGGQTPEAPNPVPRAVGTGSEDLAAGPDKGSSGTERVAITTRPIPLPPAAALAPASPSDLNRGGVLLAAYQAAVAAAPPECHLPPALLAAIGQIESGSAGGRQIGPDHRVNPPIYGPVLDGGPFAAIRDTDGGLFDGDIVWDRAVGPMQFIPGTWRTVGVDADGDGVKNPQNLSDAATATAVYLCSGPGDLTQPADLRSAILRYNQSEPYVQRVIAIADGYRRGVSVLPAQDLSAEQLNGSPYLPSGAGLSTGPSAPPVRPAAASKRSPQPAAGPAPRGGSGGGSGAGSGSTTPTPETTATASPGVVGTVTGTAGSVTGPLPGATTPAPSPTRTPTPTTSTTPAPQPTCTILGVVRVGDVCL